MPKRTPFNHGGIHRHAAADAAETLRVVEERHAELQKQAQHFDPRQPGHANRLADYARDLERAAHNLVHFLDHAGSVA